MPYVLREGTKPAVALYSRCADITYAQAELLLLMEHLPERQAGAEVLGYVDKDADYPIWRFKRPYITKPKENKRLEEIRTRIVLEGWPYQEVTDGPN